MLLVPAGPPVDSVISDLLPHLGKGDLIIDAGNSYFKDTNLRARNLSCCESRRHRRKPSVL
jgi:6-phosphogluconate dehydrogenase